MRKRLKENIETEKKSICNHISERNGLFFDAEIEKLDSWAEDRRNSLKAILEEVDAKLREAKKEARMAPNLPAKLELQKQLRQLESRRNEAWKEYDEASNEVDNKKDTLLDEISKRLEQRIETEELFTIRWVLK